MGDHQNCNGRGGDKLAQGAPARQQRNIPVTAMPAPRPAIIPALPATGRSRSIDAPRRSRHGLEAMAELMGTARVLGISGVEPLGDRGALTISGVARSGRHLASGYAARTPVELSWQCTADLRGMVMTVSIQPAQRAYGGSYSGIPAPYEGDDYSRYGYHRY